MPKSRASSSRAPSSAAVALRAAAAELERQAASLRAKADRLDGAAAAAVKLKPGKKAKALPAAARGKLKPLPAGPVAYKQGRAKTGRKAKRKSARPARAKAGRGRGR